MVFESIKKLVNYGIKAGLMKEEDRTYVTNRLLDFLNLEDYEDTLNIVTPDTCYETLEELLDYAVSEKIISGDSMEEKDWFDTKLMNCLMPRPSEVIHEFNKRYSNSPKRATDYFYKLSQDSNYIRRDRIAKDKKWVVSTKYGDLDITINLSKPEKDPKAIAAAKLVKQGGYPKCLLCKENEGFRGRAGHPARDNHRVIPITINNSPWGLQYSPYVYYNEHCIVFHGEHVPMKVEKATFQKLFDFIEQFPHYFIGSNADLPIVGGSILTHDHFQGGNYTFAMEKAEIEKYFTIRGFEDVEVGIVFWPLSVIRIRSKQPSRLIELADYILGKWRGYTDESAYVFAETDGERHNTITPIARMRDDYFELDLTLRNNIMTEECPLGLYHPHNELHHIKKENIGLIEVLGLAILPSRLMTEIELLADAILAHKDITAEESIAKHAAWVEEFLPNYSDITKDNITGILEQEIGKVFTRVLEDAGVYKCNRDGRFAFERFIQALNEVQ